MDLITLCKYAHTHLEEIKNRVNKDNINMTDYFEYTPFHYVCENASYSSQTVYYNIIKFFIANGASLNAINWFGETAFYFMCNNINVSKEIIKMAYDHNANIDFKTCDNTNILHTICHNHTANVDMVKYVMSIGGHKYVNNKDNDNNTPLHFICQNGNLLDMSILPTFIKDINSKNKYGNTPFCYVCSNWSITLSILQYFVDNSAELYDQNYYGSTPLHYLCKNTKVNEKMLMILTNTNSINVQNNDSITPLHLLMENPKVSNKVIKKIAKMANKTTLKGVMNSPIIPFKRKMYAHLETLDTIIVDDKTPCIKII